LRLWRDQPSDLALALRALRGGRTQGEVADQAGLTVGTWNRYENSRQVPKAAQLPRLAQGLGVPLEALELAIEHQRRERIDRQLRELRSAPLHALPAGSVDAATQGLPALRKACFELGLAIENVVRAALEGQGGR
jgi:transcriptional regulator with XRE-family HTH domain